MKRWTNIIRNWENHCCYKATVKSPISSHLFISVSITLKIRFTTTNKLKITKNEQA